MYSPFIYLDYIYLQHLHLKFYWGASVFTLWTRASQWRKQLDNTNCAVSQNNNGSLMKLLFINIYCFLQTDPKEASSNRSKCSFCVHIRSVANVLRSNGKAESQYFECVTVYFSEIVGFGSISSELNPHQVCDLLNALYKWVYLFISIFWIVCLAPCRNIKGFGHLRFIKSFWHWPFIMEVYEKKFF